jgi:hypothetical protein
MSPEHYQGLQATSLVAHIALCMLCMQRLTQCIEYATSEYRHVLGQAEGLCR